VLAYNGGTLQVPSLSAGTTTLGNTTINGTITVFGTGMFTGGTGGNLFGPVTTIIDNGPGSANNSIVTSATQGFPLAQNLGIDLVLNHSLQAGANTLDYQHTGIPIAIKNVYGNNLTTGLSGNPLILHLIYNAYYWQTQTP
jgi:hypothetical protein